MKHPKFQVIPNKRTLEDIKNSKFLEEILDYEYKEMIKNMSIRNLMIQIMSYEAMGIPREGLNHLYKELEKKVKKHLLRE